MAALAYALLQRTIIRAGGGRGSPLAQATGRDWKGKISVLIYFAGIIAAYRAPWLSQSLYVLGAVIWLVPDRRIERANANHPS